MKVADSHCREQSRLVMVDLDERTPRMHRQGHRRCSERGAERLFPTGLTLLQEHSLYYV
jgi:hypothetical protein